MSATPVTALGTRYRVAMGLASLVAAVTVLGGCSSSADAGSAGAPDKGYVSGDGNVTLTAVHDRHDPVEVRGRTLEGRSFNLADHRGQVVVVNVWGSWCPPCIAEAPGLERFYRSTRGKDVTFVGIDTRDQPAAARAHQRRFHVGYPSLDDQEGRALLAFRGTLPPVAIPSTLVLDREGRVAARVLGQVDPDVLRGITDDVLAEHSANAVSAP